MNCMWGELTEEYQNAIIVTTYKAKAEIGSVYQIHMNNLPKKAHK